MKRLILILPHMNMRSRAHDQHVQETAQHFASCLSLHIERITVTRTLTGKKRLILELSGAVDLKAVLRAGSHAFFQRKIDGLVYQDEEMDFTARMRGTWRRTWF